MGRFVAAEVKSVGQYIRILLAVVTAVTSIVIAPLAVSADDVQVYLVEYAKFKPGKAPEALRIIHEHFHRVDAAIGRKVLPFDYVTGEWDHIVYFPYDNARMETIPPGSEWMKALAAQEGGMDKAQKLWQQFWSLVANRKTEIARLPRAFAP
jgi:hypothetical protein